MEGDDISIGAIIGSGSFAEVRRGLLKNTISSRGTLPKESKLSAATILRMRSKSDVPAEIALKVLRDVKRQTLRRFWFEVLIMKVCFEAVEGGRRGCCGVQITLAFFFYNDYVAFLGSSAPRGVYERFFLKYRD